MPCEHGLFLALPIFSKRAKRAWPALFNEGQGEAASADAVFFVGGQEKTPSADGFTSVADNSFEVCLETLCVAQYI